MTVRKGPRLTYKYNKNPYYIELSNTYSILAEFLDNPSKTDQPISTDRNFKLKAAIRRQEKTNKQIEKNIINTEDNDALVISAAIKLSDDERSAQKKAIHQKDKARKANSTTNHKHNNRSTRDGAHMRLKIKPSIASYKQHNNKPMITYD